MVNFITRFVVAIIIIRVVETTIVAVVNRNASKD